jgi:hypothetical protein
VGGAVDVTASYQGQTAVAKLTVQLHLQQNPGMVSSSVQQSLQGATTQDTTITWAHPYDGTVFPRGVGEAPLMWMNGGATDAYYVHLTSPTFELESYMTAAAGRYDFDAATWQEFIDSTSGSAELKVSRWNGTTATLAADPHWTIGPAWHNLLLGHQYGACHAHPCGCHGAGRLPRAERHLPVVPHGVRQ